MPTVPHFDFLPKLFPGGSVFLFDVGSTEASRVLADFLFPATPDFDPAPEGFVSGFVVSFESVDSTAITVRKPTG
jgi:hypothetical protein